MANFAEQKSGILNQIKKLFPNPSSFAYVVFTSAKYFPQKYSETTREKLIFTHKSGLYLFLINCLLNLNRVKLMAYKFDNFEKN